ncbi:hypothetical protein CQ052_05630 [Ochrobactrum sp. MYb15]|nr:hypothetical protein CWE02_17550 [Brucella pituitosa]PQZ51815.1 hypothetical protein CQZ90_03260 [Ochrobactrum sp. MYb19]PRA65151.1 hypothetical protein CQ053_09155 [Ochrobactrum sp. MYb18]PRA76840.1 hypothetical protein CQ049_05630 [Brucella thiophenivorans]PRA86143.1 hypothetical protein CQ054_11895 [Ochrobactrum sp. MYb29]PRA93526.1 hypothetical protein CQ051_03260 [Ochrobactrum sp. MYb14]PRA98848.1 hypothetical protein CQ052_05630 [Ochrobactrum sp. MYb15]
MLLYLPVRWLNWRDLLPISFHPFPISLRNQVSRGSVLLSGVTVNALAFTFRIAYQKAGCSIFVLVLNVPIAIEQPPSSWRGSSPYCGAARRKFHRRLKTP